MNGKLPGLSANEITEIVDFGYQFWHDATWSAQNYTVNLNTKDLSWQPKKAVKNTSYDLIFYLVDSYGIPFSVKAYDYRYEEGISVGEPSLSNFYVSVGNLGDIVLLNKANGKVFVKSPEEFSTEESSATPIAVIVYADNEHIWGMGLEESALLAWCSNSCAGANFNFSDKNLEIYINNDINSGGNATPDADLADDWEVIKKYDSIGATDPATKYPAFNYCLTYGTSVLSLNSNSSNENIKALAGEWCMINKHIGYSLSDIKSYLNNSFSLLGVTTGIANLWCSSSPNTTNATYTTTSHTQSTAKTDTKYVRPVFDFFDMLSE